MSSKSDNAVWPMAGKDDRTGRGPERLFVHTYLRPWVKFAGSALKTRRYRFGINSAGSGEERQDILGPK
jgi:hypothetical protein